MAGNEFLDALGLIEKDVLIGGWMDVLYFWDDLDLVLFDFFVEMLVRRQWIDLSLELRYFGNELGDFLPW